MIFWEASILGLCVWYKKYKFEFPIFGILFVLLFVFYILVYTKVRLLQH